jgi:hypothetical protein
MVTATASTTWRALPRSAASENTGLVRGRDGRQLAQDCGEVECDLDRAFWLVVRISDSSQVGKRMASGSSAVNSGVKNGRPTRVDGEDRMVDSEPTVLQLDFLCLDVRRPELVERLGADLASDDVLARRRGVHRA